MQFLLFYDKSAYKHNPLQKPAKGGNFAGAGKLFIEPWMLVNNKYLHEKVLGAHVKRNILGGLLLLCNLHIL
jgi:hypothetical protein